MAKPPTILSLPPQSQAILQLLFRGKELTARQIGEALGIFPNTVYRAIQVLEYFGCIRKVHGWPVRFAAVQISQALNAYLDIHRTRFQNVVGEVKQDKRSKPVSLRVSFIQSRNEWLMRSIEDIALARREVDLIVSGHEAPAELIYEHKRAIDRGVRTRMLVQQKSDSNYDMFGTMQRMGMNVRVIQSVDVRLTIIDSQVAYILSYSPKDYIEAVGVRFAYEPIAILIQDVFNKRWSRASRIDPIGHRKTPTLER